MKKAKKALAIEEEGRRILKTAPKQSEPIQRELFPGEKITTDLAGLHSKEAAMAFLAAINMEVDDRAATLDWIERMRNDAENVIQAMPIKPPQTRVMPDGTTITRFVSLDLTREAAEETLILLDQLNNSIQVGDDVHRAVILALKACWAYSKMTLMPHEENAQLGRERRETNRQKVEERWIKTASQREARDTAMRSEADRLRTKHLSEKSIAEQLEKKKYNTPPIKWPQIRNIIKKCEVTE